jgi:hypothetical protein
LPSGEHQESLIPVVDGARADRSEPDSGRKPAGETPGEMFVSARRPHPSTVVPPISGIVEEIRASSPW